MCYINQQIVIFMFYVKSYLLIKKKSVPKKLWHTLFRPMLKSVI